MFSYSYDIYNIYIYIYVKLNVHLLSRFCIQHTTVRTFVFLGHINKRDEYLVFSILPREDPL